MGRSKSKVFLYVLYSTLLYKANEYTYRVRFPLPIICMFLKEEGCGRFP